MSQWAIAEYLCPVHGRFEALVERPVPDEQPCPCGASSPWTISAPKTTKDSRPCYAEVRGGDTERRPGMLDTRPLAEGMSPKEWRKKQRGVTEERRHQQMLKRGLKQKRIQVG